MNTGIIQRVLQLDKQLSGATDRDALPIVARYTTDTAQSIPDSTWTILNFEDVEYDPVSAVTTGAAWKFTAPIGGHFSVKVFVEIEFDSAITTGTQFYLAIYVDGAEYSRIGRSFQYVTSSNSDAYLLGSDDVYLAKDSYLDVRAWHDKGAAGALNGDEHENHIAVHMISQGV